jgi:uncharacterized protein YPO0396
MKRVHISRIIAINWYGYQKMIDLSGLTLITGANGSGKSVLLDLIQFVMLGENLSRFNKAAAGAGSGRSLRGYCLCDTNTQSADGQERYLRQSSVTFAALEFAWPADAQGVIRRETWGARIEYESPTAKPRTLWFTLPQRMETEHFFIKTLDGKSEFMPENEFRVHVKRDLGGELFDRQASYLDEMASRVHLGFDRIQMNKTLPNSMAFQPVESFERFIRDYLLEPGLPDVKAVRMSVDAHRRAQDRLGKMQDQYERLKRICDQHTRYDRAATEEKIYRHLRDALIHLEKEEALQQRKDRLESLRIQNAEDLSAHDSVMQEISETDQQYQAVCLVAGKDSQVAMLNENRHKHAELSKEVDQLRDAAKSAKEFLYTKTTHWKQWLRHAEEISLEIPAIAETRLKAMQGADEAAGLDAVERMPAVFEMLKSQAHDELRPLEEKLRELESKQSRLNRDIEELQRKGSTMSSPLLDHLKSRGQRAEALARVIEVKEEAEAWWPLLENLLDDKRHAILVDDFASAWEQARQQRLPDEWLVNPKEIADASSSVKAGTVAALFETKHPLAQQYLQHAFGDMVCVANVQALEKHPRGFSQDGWLKDPPHRRLITPSRELSIGEEGMRRLRDLRLAELEQTQQELGSIKHRRDQWRNFLHRGNEWNLSQGERPSGTSRLHRLPDLRKQLLQLDETIKLLATPEREAAVAQMNQLHKTLLGLNERKGKLMSVIQDFSQKERELIDAIVSLQEEENEARLQKTLSRESTPQIRDAEIQERIVQAMKQYARWPQRIEGASAIIHSCVADADKARRERDMERRALVEAHRELTDSFDVNDEGNAAYQARCTELETHELERYTTAAEDARREWEERLQHQVLDVLKEKLEEAERTKRELNRAMDHNIGGWKYQLSMRMDRAHSAIWTLVEKGLSAGLELFAASGKEDIERAKEALMTAIENAEDPRHQKALDYRYYHQWDIQAIPAGKTDAAAISLNKNAKKQSGGENQAPFFVAMLAAFQRVYDLGRKHHNCNLGIVIMDEAFSKLSGDRIDDCLALARNFGLQLIMAFPEDRLPTMIQHAETVVQCRVHRTYDEASGQIQNIENWCIRVDRERLIENLL